MSTTCWPSYSSQLRVRMRPSASRRRYSGVPGKGVTIANRGRSMPTSTANSAVRSEDAEVVVIEAEHEAALERDLEPVQVRHELAYKCGVVESLADVAQRFLAPWSRGP